jgi:mRNA interferase YafQ
MELLKKAIMELEKTGTLHVNNKPHKLSGNYDDIWEAHLKPDWLLLWKVYPENNEVWLIRSGTHSDLF